MAFSTPTNKTWVTVRRESREKIMGTDIIIEIVCLPIEQERAQQTLDEAFIQLKDFESRFSRFQENNELWEFNHATEKETSEKLWLLLLASRFFHTTTHGIFDPTILPVLEQEGYTSAYKTSSGQSEDFSSLQINSSSRLVHKPLNTWCDFGGIGKGFIVDSIAVLINQSFRNFFIDAGGDIYTRGGNLVLDYPYWGIGVENPHQADIELALLTLSDMAVATSGKNRRRWADKHHLIDPFLKKSSASDLTTVTVVAASTICADVLAKVLFLLGFEKGKLFAEEYKIPALFVKDSKEAYTNEYIQPYVWK